MDSSSSSKKKKAKSRAKKAKSSIEKSQPANETTTSIEPEITTTSIEQKEECPTPLEPPKFALVQLLIRAWIPPHGHIILTDVKGNAFEFEKIEELASALAKREPQEIGPIAQIRLEQCTLTDKFFKLFESLNPKLLDGGALELYGPRCTERAVVRFLKLFKPISVHIASYEELAFNVCSALRNVDTIHSAKHLMLFPRYFAGNPMMFNIDAHMVYASITINPVLDWLEVSPQKYPPSPKSPAWNPPKPAAKARLVDVLLGSVTDEDVDPVDELTNVWRHPANKLLLFHEDGIVGWDAPVANPMAQPNVEHFIEECKKRFQKAEKRLNYCVKVMCKMGCTKPMCMAPCAPAPVKPRAFTNTLGEHLRVSIQKLDLEGYTETDFFPPHDLVIIERFHPTGGQDDE